MRRTIHAIDGEKLRNIRDEQGYSARQFALKVGISEGYLNKLENGHQQPSPSVRKRITDVLRVKLAAIAAEKPAPSSTVLPESLVA